VNKLHDQTMIASPHLASRQATPFLCASKLFLTIGVVTLALCPHILWAQAAAAGAGTAGPPAAPAVDAPITLDEAIRRAQGSDVAYISAAADKTVAGLDKTIARSTLLPGVVYHNQYLYTQPGLPTSASARALTTGTTSIPIFIANNAVHEYMSQGVVTETIGVAGIADYHRLSAEAEASAARQEVARRGLVATVIGNYYEVLAAERKVAVV